MSQRREFSPGDCVISAFGKELEGWKKVSYKSELEGTINKSGNNRNTSHSLGDQKDEFTIELYQSAIREWEKQRKLQTGKASILGMQVALAVNYSNDEMEEVTDIIHFTILSQGREVAGGSEGLAFELKTLCLDIQFDA